MKISTFSNGLRGFWSFNSTPEVPNQRNVVFSPISGRPSCIQRATALPLRTLTHMPAANQPTKTMTATKNSVFPASGEIAIISIITQWLTHLCRYYQQLAPVWTYAGKRMTRRTRVDRRWRVDVRQQCCKEQ